MSDEKTEEPTDKKLEDAKRKGQVPKSQDLSAAVNLGGMSVLLTAGAAMTLERIMALTEKTMLHFPQVTDTNSMYALISSLTLDALIAVMPFVLASVMLGILGNVAQTGVIITFEPLTPNFDKLNPAEGIKKLISMKSFIELGKSIVKAVALGCVLWSLITDLIPLLVGSAYVSPAAIATIGWEASLNLVTATVLVFLLIGPVDYGLQKYLFIKDQRMSKDEIKREYKEMEGDPQMKGQRKQIAKEMVESPPQKTVPGASVVVTNPTHYAVALRYEAGETALPIVVAKGLDAEAKEIRRIAEEHLIPIVEDPPLARSLHKIPLNDPVPEALFEAVASVLRWVMFLRGASKTDSAARAS